MIEQQKALALDLIPEWKDEEVRKQEVSGLKTFLQDQGFSEDEINSITDARALKIARMAWKIAQGEQKLEKSKPTTKKRVKLKPGRRKSAGDRDKRRSQEARRRLKSEGSVEAAADLLKDIL